MMIDITAYADVIEAAIEYGEVCEIYFRSCEDCPLYECDENEDYNFESDLCFNMPYVPHDLLMQFAASILLPESSYNSVFEDGGIYRLEEADAELPEYAKNEDEERVLMYEMNIGTEDMQKEYDDGEFEYDDVKNDDKKEN
jgi:hypothetical protein